MVGAYSGQSGSKGQAISDAYAHAGLPAPQMASPDQLQQQVWNTVADWMRQTYMNTYADNSPTLARKWLTNQQGFFQRLQGNPVFDTLNSELTQHARAANPEVLRGVTTAATASKAELERNAAGIVLKAAGKGPEALDTALTAPAAKQGALMQGLIDDVVKGDPTLQGFRGLQRMLWDRVMTEAAQADPLRPGQEYYSFGAAKKFVDGAKPAFDVMRAADPAWGKNMDRLLNTLVVEDRARVGTGLTLPPEVQPPGLTGHGLGRDLATKLFQLGFSRFTAPLLEGISGGGMAHSMQSVGMASSFAHNIANAIMPKSVKNAINAYDMQGKARQAIEDALMDTNTDPTKMRGLLAPIAGPRGGKHAAGIEPWLQSAGVMLPQGWLNPSPDTVPANPNPQPPAPGDRPVGELPKWYDLPGGKPPN